MTTHVNQKSSLSIACDHAGFELKQSLLKQLQGAGYICEDLGCDNADSVDYADYAKKLVESIKGTEQFGILICGSGVGMSIAANRDKNMRAALCEDADMAEMARLHNDANILVLGARRLESSSAFGIVDKFLTTEFSGDEHHVRRIDKISV